MIEVVAGDVTSLAVDVIVNAADSALPGGGKPDKRRAAASDGLRTPDTSDDAA